LAKRIRLGAVGYLNARPLTYGLEQSELFDLRFDPPSTCAELLQANAIDVGMIPSIEYNRGPEYRIVPGMGIISEGDVASVALFARKPLSQVRTIAADTSSRTSNGLVRILCAERFGIEPEFRPMAPQPERMFQECDAALIIGDPALYLDPAAHGVEKIDLGQEWTSMTGLPFVWAFWAGRPDVLTLEAVGALAEARDRGVKASDRIAAEYCGAERADLGQAYLRENIYYRLREREEAGLRRYYELAAKHGLIDAPREVQTYSTAAFS
jgi:chorismate dehydratase